MASVGVSESVPAASEGRTLSPVELIDAEEASAEKSPPPAEQGRKKGDKKAVPAPEVKQLPEVENPVTGDSELEGLFAKELGLDNGAVPGESEPDPEDLDLPDGVDPKSRAAKRFQQKVNEAREARQQMQQMQAQWQQQQAQWQQYVMDLREQHARATAQLEMYGRGMQPQQQEAVDPNDPYHVLQSRFLQEAQNKLVDPKYQELHSEIGQLKQVSQQQQEAAKQHQRQLKTQRIQQSAQSAARDIVLQGLDPEIAQHLEYDTVNMLLARQYATQTSEVESAKALREFLLRFGLATVRGKQKATREKLQAAQDIPSPTPTAHMQSGGEAEPSYDQIIAAGYRDPLEWAVQGKKPLPPVRRK